MNNDEYNPMTYEEIIEIFKVLEIEDEEKRVKINQRLLAPDSDDSFAFETKLVDRIEMIAGVQEEQ